MKLDIQVASTSQTVNVFIQDSSSTTGGGLTGLAYNSAGLTAYYALPKAAAVSITLATLAAVTSTYSSGGFKEIDATNMPGWYRFDIPDAAIASGRFVSIHLKGATNMAPLPIEIELTAWNNQDAVRGGMTALPNANAEAAGGLYTRGTGAGQINQPANGMADMNLVRWLGTAASTPTVAGVPNVNVKTWNDLATVALPLIPTTAGRTLDVSAGGEAGLDWANVGSPTTALDLSGTTIKTTQKVDVDTIKTNPVVNGGTITFPTNKTVADSSLLPAALTANGNIKASLVEILTTALTETAGLLAGGFKKFFNVASPTLTCLGVDQTGDSYTRLGAPAGASISTDIQEIEAETDTLLAGVTVTTNNDKTGYSLTSGEENSIADAILVRVITESYAALHAAPTVAQAICEIRSLLSEFAIAGTSVTTKKLDGSTTATVATLDSSTAPTSRTRTT